ncbi:MAG: DUF1330 domain-containing protein [Myxococcales bacterium]|nr:DUF1330 domain-containing protein [Myxococcales bacterium]
MSETFVHATQESGRAFVMRQLQGPVVMLNLLRFREVADYSEHPELAPESPISGEQAYRLYARHTLPILAGIGSQVLYDGTGGAYLIGPTDQHWDRVLLVRHPDAATFLSFAQDPVYLATAGHRTAALADARLLPLQTTSPT